MADRVAVLEAEVVRLGGWGVMVGGGGWEGWLCWCLLS